VEYTYGSHTLRVLLEYLKSRRKSRRRLLRTKMSSQRHLLKGWRFAAFIGSIVGAVGLAIYPIIISPYLHPEKWKRVSKEFRDGEGIRQEAIQPGNMKVWSDPFDRPGKPGN